MTEIILILIAAGVWALLAVAIKSARDLAVIARPYHIEMADREPLPAAELNSAE